jgi:hypothetical protein
LFPVVESVHLAGLALLVGTIALADFELLRGRPASRLATGLAPWTHGGLAVMFLTGLLMFFSDVFRYVHNPAFLLKMVVLAAALGFHFSIHRKIQGRWTAATSLILWSCVVLAGRGIADFDV